VASATVPTVSASLAQTATSITGTNAGQAGANLTLTIAGTPATGDNIVITVACPTGGGSVSLSAATASSGTPSATVDTWGTSFPVGGNGDGCGNNELVITPTAATTPQVNPVVQISGLVYTTSGVQSQALALSGSYETLGAAATTFAVPSNATVVWYNVQSNIPAVTLGGSATTSISNISITEPANINLANTTTDYALVTGSTITLTLPTHDSWEGTPSAIVSGTGVTVGFSAIGSDVLTATITGSPVVTNSTLIQIMGLSVATTSSSLPGAQTVAITTDAGLANTALALTSVGTILGSTAQIYGPDGTPDGTVAQEFESAFPVNSTGTGAVGGNSTVVLATDADPYDALSAAYLEGQLHTGLLITPPTTFGADAMAAMRLEGVQTVYVVGGSLAITPAVISQIEATPAYNPGGLTTTGSDLKVVGPIAGATADITAQDIATYFGASYGSVQFASAYGAATSTSGGGLYNDTVGTASTSGPTTSSSTAIVLSDTDWQDAMSIAPEAYALRLPIVLTTPTALSAAASSALTTLGAKQVIVVGGQLALTNTVVTSIQALNGGVSVLRLAGQDATDTAGQIANFALAAAPSGLGWDANGTKTVLASHANYWSDALGAAALGGGASSTYGYEPLVLVESPLVVGTYTTAELATLKGLSPNAITGITVLGGPLAMPATTVSALQAGLAG
jgi:putative cell wall-binding protein